MPNTAQFRHPENRGRTSQLLADQLDMDIQGVAVLGLMAPCRPAWWWHTSTWVKKHHPFDCSCLIHKTYISIGRKAVCLLLSTSGFTPSMGASTTAQYGLPSPAGNISPRKRIRCSEASARVLPWHATLRASSARASSALAARRTHIWQAPEDTKPRALGAFQAHVANHGFHWPTTATSKLAWWH